MHTSHAATLWILALLPGCVGQEVFSGRRCPVGELRCGSATDAGIVADASQPQLDAQACSCDGGARGLLAGNTTGERCDCTTTGAADAGIACGEAGVYTGSYSIRSTSGPAGICGVVAQLQPGTGFGRWQLSLSRRDAASSAITGCLLGTPNAGDAGLQPPFRAALIGTLDCNTGALRAELQGTYKAVAVCDLGTVTKDYYFKGTLAATLAPDALNLSLGEVQFTEPPVAIGPAPGGEITWSAARERGVTPSEDDTRDCLNGVPFREDLFPAADAGP
jgi:hypothetical protein